MKKIALLLMCVAAIAMVSCGGNSNKKTGVKASETKTSVAASDAIDLGLSVKWAKTNLGAKDASDPGNYYAWGETETKRFTTATRTSSRMATRLRSTQRMTVTPVQALPTN